MERTYKIMEEEYQRINKEVASMDHAKSDWIVLSHKSSPEINGPPVVAGKLRKGKKKKKKKKHCGDGRVEKFES